MAFPVVLLWIDAVLFVGFGLGFVAAPAQLADLILGAAPTTASALIDMRATYGGVAIGTGLFFALCAARPQWLRPGLVASLLVVGALETSRVIGILADGSPNAFMLLFLAFEVLFTGLTVAALRQAEPSLVPIRP
jgi:hypothetical protein